MIRKIIVYIVVFGSLSMFDLIVLPKAAYNALELLSIALIFILLIANLIYGQKGDKQNSLFIFKNEIILILFAVALSTFAAAYFYGQKIPVTLYAQRPLYFFFFYFLLHQLRLPVKFFVQLVFYIALVYAFFYLAQTFLYPRQITHNRVAFDRGTIRIFIPGAGYMILAFFISLNSYLRESKVKYLIFMGLAAIIFVLLGTRQVLASVGLMAILNIIFSKRIQSKFSIIFMIILAIIPIYFLFQDIILSMMEVTEKQSQNFSDDIRVRAATYFLTDFNHNKLWYFTGNGVNGGTSLYQQKVIHLMLTKHYYMSDIGMIGDFVQLGIIYVVATLIIMIKIETIRLPEEMHYIKYYIGIMFLTFFTGKTTDPAGIAQLCILLYMIDKYYIDKNETVLPVET